MKTKRILFTVCKQERERAQGEVNSKFWQQEMNCQRNGSIAFRESSWQHGSVIHLSRQSLYDSQGAQVGDRMRWHRWRSDHLLTSSAPPPMSVGSAVNSTSRTAKPQSRDQVSYRKVVFGGSHQLVPLSLLENEADRLYYRNPQFTGDCLFLEIISYLATCSII